MGEDTRNLKALAPAAAEWPSWWRRNLTPGVLYTIAAVVLGAAVTVTTFVVSAYQDRARLASIQTTVDAIKLDVGVMKEQVADLKAWKDRRQELAEELSNPYAKKHPQQLLEQKQRKATP